MSINCSGAEYFHQSLIPIENSDILGISWKYKDFTIGFPIVMKMFFRIHSISAPEQLIDISNTKAWKFMEKMRETSFADQKSLYTSFTFCANTNYWNVQPPISGNETYVARSLEFQAVY